MTNGLEALEDLKGFLSDAELAEVNFVRIQSSHCEANAFYHVLDSLDNNLLFHLATGARCLVYDFGARDTQWPSAQGELRSQRIPRALWWGLEWSRYALARLWRVDLPHKPILRGYSVQDLFADKYRAMPKALYKRLRYYRKFNPQVVDLAGVYRAYGTAHDGNDGAYAAMAAAWCDGLPPAADFALPPGFLEYRSHDYARVGRGKCARVVDDDDEVPPVVQTPPTTRPDPPS